ncbi:hypothetical protein IMZ68_00710, partial [Candidatus Bathyarchaeota archaeon]|nr:hypothetical protein [Candidatus Bathyarchaeota archaeon]
MANSSVDIDQLYEKCLSGNQKYRVTARTVYDYCISPFMVYCDKFGPQEKKDPLNEYDKLLFDQGKSHENQVITNNYPGLKKISYKNLEEGFKLLLQEMTKGTPVICGVPIFYLPEGLMGIVDVLEKRKDQKSIFGNFHYIVKEIKLARNIKKAHVYQA